MAEPPIRMDRLNPQQLLEAARQRNTDSEGRFAELWSQKIIILAIVVVAFLAGILIGKFDTVLFDAYMQGMEVGGWVFEILAVVLAMFTAYLIWTEAELPKAWKGFSAVAFFVSYALILSLVGVDPLFLLLIVPPAILVASLCRLTYSYKLDSNQSAAAQNEPMTTKVWSAFKALFKKKMVLTLLVYGLVFYAFLFTPQNISDNGRATLDEIAMDALNMKNALQGEKQRRMMMNAGEELVDVEVALDGEQRRLPVKTWQSKGWMNFPATMQADIEALHSKAFKNQEVKADSGSTYIFHFERESGKIKISQTLKGRSDLQYDVRSVTKEEGKTGRWMQAYLKQDDFGRHRLTGPYELQLQDKIQAAYDTACIGKIKKPTAHEFDFCAMIEILPRGASRPIRSK